jgi:hypothetical protein
VFSPRALNQLLKGYSSLRFCQFVQDQAQGVTVRGVASAPQAKQDLAGVAARLEKLLGSGMHVSWTLASEPIIRRGGKMPLIVRQQLAVSRPPQPETICQA